MPDPIAPPAQATTLPQPPRIPTGQEIFDAIMGHIEPELTSAGVQALPGLYKNETPEQKGIRQKRYELAIERYEQAYEGYIATLHAQVKRYASESYRHVELTDRHDEGGFLDQLTHQILAV